MKERVAIVAGIRSPFCKAEGVFKNINVDDLGAYVIRELLLQTEIPPEKVDEVIIGNVLQPPHATNVARVISVKGGVPVSVPAYTVDRNCASGMESIVNGMNKILLGEASIIIAGGAESMSNFPILFRRSMRQFLSRLSKAKTLSQKLLTLASFRPSFLAPEIPEIADPLCGLTMGQTAEIIAKQFKVTREDQDQYALLSQERAMKAIRDGILAQEIVPIPLPPTYQEFQTHDEGPRANQTLEALAKLKPVFDKVTGTVTAGNSSQVTDGAAAVLLMKESKAKEMGYKPLGYIREYAAAALDPSRMGLGPAYATAKLLAKTGLKLSDFDLIEINEAFAAQIVACERAFLSPEFCKKELGRDTVIGELSRDKLNVNGGAIALGHPLGASGTRLVLTLLKELNRRKLNNGLATLCVGGGQGESVWLEVQ